MKLSTELWLFCLLFTGFMVASLFTGSETLWGTTLVMSGIYAVGSQLARLIEKQNGGTNK